MNNRTYYGFQMYSAWNGPMDYITSRKPNHYLVKCRATNIKEAREKLDSLWINSCYEALPKLAVRKLEEGE